MNLKKVLSLKTVKFGLPGSTKEEIIQNLVNLIVDSGKNLDRDLLLKAVLDREAQMSTGMKNEVAIPHGKTDAVDGLYAAIAVSAEPVDFGSLDKKPSRIFLMTISPQSHTGPHLQFLAEVSGLMSKEGLRERILAAKDSQELLQVFLRGKT